MTRAPVRQLFLWQAVWLPLLVCLAATAAVVAAWGWLPPAGAVAATVLVVAAGAWGVARYLRRLVRRSLLHVQLNMKCLEGDREAVGDLLARGASPRARPGSHPLHAAVSSRDPEIVGLLLEHGARPVTPELPAEQEPLLAAAARGRTELVARLLAAGAPVDLQRPDLDRLPDATPLHLAAMGGHVETVNLLLERGASPTARAAGQTPAEAAARAGQVLTAERLRRAAAGAAPS